MIKLLFLSAIVMLILIPIRFSRARSPQHGLRQALLAVLLFNLAYWLVVLFGYFHLWVGMDPSRALEK